MDSRLEALESYARDNSIPVLLKDSAEFLEKLVASLKPKNILEIGTAIGYSGSIMLLASPEAKLTTIDKNTSSLAIAKQVAADLISSSSHLSKVMIESVTFVYMLLHP